MFVLALAALCGCSGGGGAGNPGPSSAELSSSGPLTVRSISFTSGETEAPFSESVRTYLLRSFSIADTTPKAVFDASGVQRILVNGVQRPPTAEQPLTIDDLQPGARLDIALYGTDGTSRSYTFQLVPDDLPAFETTSALPTPGRVALTAYPVGPGKRSFLLVTSETGKLLAFRSNELPVADFQLQRNASGRERYTFCEYDPAIFTIKSSTGACHLLDASLRKLADLNAVPSPANPAGVTDHHEVVLLDDNHYLVPAYVSKSVNNIPRELLGSAPGPRTVVTSVIQEVKDGKVIFEWDGSRFPELYSAAVLDNDFTNPGGKPDYMHVNSVAVDTDGNLIASFRHLSQVLKIHRSTGEILWRLGGRGSDFPLAQEQRFSAQHHARRNADGSLTLYDNGNLDTPQVSRALRFQLDEGRKTVADFRSAGYQGIYASATGSAQFLSADRTFIGLGFVSKSSYVDVVEVDAATGQAAFTLKLSDPLLFAYRALKYTR
jgi:hypothetical protein